VLLSELKKERGLSNEEVAAILAEQNVTVEGKDGPRPVNANDVARRTPKNVPRAWRAALGVESPSRVTGDGGGGPDPLDRDRRLEIPPARPAGAPIVVQPFASKRIAGGYRFVGGLVATQIVQSHGKNAGNGVAEAFDKNADHIADLWVKAAEQNATVARIVNAMGTGGAVGDLVIAHVLLFATVAYVLGAPLPDGMFKSYESYRVIVPAQPAEQQANGTANAAAASAVVDNPV
jgi:hypothetical protein